MRASGSSVDMTAATADYLAEMATELAETGNRAGLPFLAYLFSMAEAEARHVARRRPAGRAPRARVPAAAARAPIA